MARVIAEGVGTVWVHAQNGGIDMIPFAEGDEVPDWAAKQMGDHCFDGDAPAKEPQGSSDGGGGSDPAQVKYVDMKQADLKAAIAKRNEGRPVELQIEPAGKKNADLAAALEADDKDGAASWEDLTIEQLNEVIDARNEDREDDDKIVVEGDGNKPDIIAALTADDEA